MKNAMSEAVNRARVLNARELTGTKSALENSALEGLSPVSRWLWVLGVMALMLVLSLCLFHATLLASLARIWVVDEPVSHADAILVLGGRPDLRAVEAARLYHQGIAPTILYMDVRLSPSAELGITQSEREQTHRLLLSNNVPETAMIAIGRGVASTFDEAEAFRIWAATNKVRSVLIPTDLFHTRRSRWIFQKTLHDTDVVVHMRAILPEDYDTNNWWQHEEGLINFQNEVIKFMYYWCRY